MFITYARWGWHALANRIGVAAPHILANPWVLDGDSVEDRATGVRYRLANIDAPEIGDAAKCYKEAERGQLAKWVAVRLVRAAKLVTARNTWRRDKFGRRVALVFVDGMDLGELLIKRGLARPWRGRREKWCGPDGGLARIATTGAMAHVCKTCLHWR